MTSCPRCGMPIAGSTIQSRFCSTKVCRDCGVDEFMRSLLGMPPTDPDSWYNPWIARR